MQMLYKHGIFSTYLQGQEVPKWFTHRSNEPLFTLQSSPQNDDDDFEYGDEVIVWLSHWTFGKNEFEDGDEVSIHFSVKYFYEDGEFSMSYDSEGPGSESFLVNVAKSF
ncbi:hypothetical protein L1987_00860 [Smallanthus sonchifolius]|uniref:Uncharacterized protein n=1 Tax=Smallanthus sonchifolius TaxID=185202 RepID=A0ACB9K3N7_9ASTR|nr:hypothetical protein L1987_00860 [Smallanthus sonchifolius]